MSESPYWIEPYNPSTQDERREDYRNDFNDSFRAELDRLRSGIKEFYSHEKAQFQLEIDERMAKQQAESKADVERAIERRNEEYRAERELDRQERAAERAEADRQREAERARAENRNKRQEVQYQEKISYLEKFLGIVKNKLSTQKVEVNQSLKDGPSTDITADPEPDKLTACKSDEPQHNKI